MTQVDEQQRINAGDEEHDQSTLHRTNVLNFLVSPWQNTKRLVCADSYFASVSAALELWELGLHFIGVVKKETEMYPMKYLSEVELSDLGDRKGIVAKHGRDDMQLLAFAWRVRDRRFFIASGSSLQDGTPYVRESCGQVGNEDTLPEPVRLVITQPKAAEVYYSCRACIDQHNRDRQSTLMIETKLVTHDWAMSVNLSIFAICMVDTWRIYKQLTCKENAGELDVVPFETQQEFYGHLAAELIDNNFRNADDSLHDSAATIDSRTGEAPSIVGIHLKQTTLKRKNKDGNYTARTFQGRCRICGQKTTHQCSQCTDFNCEQGNNNAWICHTSKRKMCFPTHLTKVHDMKI
jgi:hypothetical protein